MTTTLDRAIERLRLGARNGHPMVVGVQLSADECKALLKALGLRVDLEDDKRYADLINSINERNRKDREP